MKIAKIVLNIIEIVSLFYIIVLCVKDLKRNKQDDDKTERS